MEPKLIQMKYSQKKMKHIHSKEEKKEILRKETDKVITILFCLYFHRKTFLLAALDHKGKQPDIRITGNCSSKCIKKNSCSSQLF
jgi:hypothetical protein